MTILRRHLLLAAVLVVAATTAFNAPPEASAAATVTIGRLAPPNAPNGGCTHCTDFQLGASAGTSYTVPAGSWTLTSWSGEGGAAGGSVALRVFRPTGIPGQFAIVATSATEVIGVGALATFPVAIEVRPGDVIGIVTGALGGYPNSEAGSPGDKVGYVIGTPETGQAVGPGAAYPYGEAEEYVNVAATLTATTTALQVTRSGTGSGTVTSGPAGIACGSICAATFGLGEVLLAVSPDPGSTFAGWSGACSGLGACALSLAAPTTVDARFDAAAPAGSPPPAHAPTPSPATPSVAPTPAPRCLVPPLRGKTVAAAKRKLRAAHCALGHLGGSGDAKGKAGTVASQHPPAGTGRPAGSKVAIRLG